MLKFQRTDNACTARVKNDLLTGKNHNNQRQQRSFVWLRFCWYRFSSFFILFFIFFYVGILSAQINTVSPYSRYGTGELQGDGFSQNESMGGTGYGIHNAFNINYSNPASYSSIQLTTFETAVKSRITRLTTSALSDTVGTASFGYFAFAFPVSKKWGASFGLLPYSYTGYDFLKEEINSETGKTKYAYQGNGGINRFYIGSAFKIQKNLSLGANVSYFFGSINKIRFIEFPDSANVLFTRVQQTESVGDLYLNYGIQYAKELKNDWNITFGGQAALSSNIRQNNDTLVTRYRYNFVMEPDTVYADSGKQNLRIPLTFGLGITLKQNNKWLACMDFSTQQWSEYNVSGNTEKGWENGWRLSSGVQYTPNTAAINNYRKIIQYRFGAYYGKTGLKIKNTSIENYGLTCGFGLPLRKAASVVNIAFDFGERGTLRNGLVKERYLKLAIGLTLNDKWFIQRKFD